MEDQSSEPIRFRQRTADQNMKRRPSSHRHLKTVATHTRFAVVWISLSLSNRHRSQCPSPWESSKAWLASSDAAGMPSQTDIVGHIRIRKVMHFSRYTLVLTTKA